MLKYAQYLLLTVSLFYTNHLLSQRQAYSFYNGGYSNAWNAPEPYANQIIKFNDDSLEEIIEPLALNMNVGFSRAAFSDTSGSLLFASNGWRLINRSGEVLSYKLWDSSLAHPGNSGDSTSILVVNGPLFLDDPADPNNAYLLYGQHKSLSFPGLTAAFDVIFSFAKLDVSNQSLISQNNTIPIDTSALGDMVATRHANGRDWWIVKPGLFHNQYYIGLLDLTGFHFETTYIPELTSNRQANTCSQFSFDGSKYVHFTQGFTLQMHVYDFDRCLGTLSNLVVHDLSDSLVVGGLNPFALSPDGTKVYIRRSGTIVPPRIPCILQYDLNTSSYTHLINLSNAAPSLSPNGKTVIFYSAIVNQNGFPIQNFISEVISPNEVGVDCNVIENKYLMNNQGGMVMPPNYANYKLGALEGSECDTLSLITRLVSKSVQIKAFPNPSKENLIVETDGLLPANLKVRNMLGQVVMEQQLNLVQTPLNENWAKLPAGPYTLEVNNRQQHNSYSKMLKE